MTDEIETKGIESDKPTTKRQKTKPGASWKANEQHVLPKNKMPFVFTGLMLCIFLAALDQVSKVLVGT